MKNVWMNETDIICLGFERKGKDWSMKNVWMNESDIIC